MRTKACKAFSLIELLVSIAIIAIITGLSIAAYGKFTARAQNVRCVEFVQQTKTALEQLYQLYDGWPAALPKEAKNGDGLLNAVAGVALTVPPPGRDRGMMSLTYHAFKRDDGAKEYVLTGHDRFGVVTPWAMDYIVHHPDSASLSSKLPGGGTIQKHILHFAIDLDDDGITKVAHGYDGDEVLVRAQACAWSYGRDGIPNTKDDIRSWSKGQEVGK